MVEPLLSLISGFAGTDLENPSFEDKKHESKLDNYLSIFYFLCMGVACRSFYRPQTKVMFLKACVVSHSVQGGVSSVLCHLLSAWSHVPSGRGVVVPGTCSFWGVFVQGGAWVLVKWTWTPPPPTPQH